MRNIETQESIVKCRRCRRPLRSLASQMLGIGPRCAAIESALAGLTRQQQDKALEVIADGGVVPTGHAGVYRVEASKGDAAYLAHAESGNCSCAWGIRRTSAETKVCYHAAAAKLAARPVIRRVLRRSQFTKVA